MAETAQLIELLKRQIDAQQKQMEEGRKQTEALIAVFYWTQGQSGATSKGAVSCHSQFCPVRSNGRIVGRLLGEVPNLCGS